MTNLMTQKLEADLSNIQMNINPSKKVRKLTNLFGPLPTRLAVLLIPRMHDPYKLYLVVKVTNQAFQLYKIPIGIIEGEE